ncbi:hypothetical protein TNCV_1568161 [Trichonephila clavipes]|nr:hypothetical protein TNCV_1568161 [Trichonephila clavipes]
MIVLFKDYRELNNCFTTTTVVKVKYNKPAEFSVSLALPDLSLQENKSNYLLNIKLIETNGLISLKPLDSSSFWMELISCPLEDPQSSFKVRRPLINEEEVLGLE